jgi:hypothetical protein
MRDWLVPEQWQALARELLHRADRAALRPLLTEGASWFVPPVLQTLAVQGANRARGLHVASNALLRDRHRDRGRCFVIGNGPSLGKMDLRPLAHEITIAANSFYKHPHAAQLDLKYLCSADPRFFVDEPRAVEWHRLIEHHLPTTILLMNPAIFPLMQRHGLYEAHTVHVYENGIKARHADQVRFDLTKPLNVGITTGSQLAIPLAIYLGFTEIYLIGFDCNWLESHTSSYHFYDKHELWKEFDSVKSDDRIDRYETVLTSTLREFNSHALIAERSRQLGIRIVNATAGGLLDTYPRARYEDVL